MKRTVKYAIVVVITISVTSFLLKETSDIRIEEKIDPKLSTENNKNEDGDKLILPEKNIDQLMDNPDLCDKANPGVALAAETINAWVNNKWSEDDKKYLIQLKEERLKLPFYERLAFFLSTVKYYEDNEDLTEAKNRDVFGYLGNLAWQLGINDNCVGLDIVQHQKCTKLVKFIILNKLMGSENIHLNRREQARFFQSMEFLIINHNDYFVKQDITLVKKYVAAVGDGVVNYINSDKALVNDYESINAFADDFLNSRKFCSSDEQLVFLHSKLEKAELLINDYEAGGLSMKKARAGFKHTIVYRYKGGMPRYLQERGKY